MKKQLILLSIFTLFFLLSCNNKTSEDNETENNFIEITKEQFLSEKMAIGTPKKIAIEERISFTGKVVPKLNGGSVIINAPVEGIVMDIHVQPGQDIRLNETLFEIGGSAVIDLQQEFASSSAKIKQLQANFNRAKELYKENINTENDFMLAESLYKSELANYNALKLKLQNIGLNTSNIENGNYAATYRIKAPINGQISQITCVKGQFISAEHQIAEVRLPGSAVLRVGTHCYRYRPRLRSYHLRDRRRDCRSRRSRFSLLCNASRTLAPAHVG